ncbi:MAG TPA: molybdopterin-guanine dinucleotide biosynthesis protein MobB, partial [Chthonomonadaceae bacterium]|nr:molybdopterin-guanine dinucleotide biosynthesis protein MobB [Chthonomonadaceae bacterium]
MGSHKGFILWFTGLSGAGKSTLAEKLVAEFRKRDYKVELLDG